MKFSKKAAIIFLIALSIAVIAFKNVNKATIKEKKITEVTLSTQENKEGNVTVSVSPELLEVGQPVRFKIVFDTHSVDLTFDVNKVIILQDDAGNVYTNPSWEGSPAEGHHRTGSITFSQPLRATTNVELIIKEVAGIKVRKMRWKL